MSAAGIRMPSEAAIEEEIRETGFHRMACIRRIQQRRVLQREARS